MPLDKFDKAILDIIQTDNQRSHAEIGEAVNLSGSAVRRRILSMTKAGVITGNVALTNPAQHGLTLIVSVSFERESPKTYADFRAQMAKEDTVSQCYYVAGDVDFILIVHAETPAAYDKWGEAVLMSNPAIRRYSNNLVWNRTKFTTRIKPAIDGDV